jgi:hypothetical protein
MNAIRLPCRYPSAGQSGPDDLLKHRVGRDRLLGLQLKGGKQEVSLLIEQRFAAPSGQNLSHGVVEGTGLPLASVFTSPNRLRTHERETAISKVRRFTSHQRNANRGSEADRPATPIRKERCKLTESCTHCSDVDAAPQWSLKAQGCQQSIRLSRHRE